MNCADSRECISASIDRRLSAVETERLAAHLAGCPECRHAHEELEAGDALLRRMAKIDLPAGFEDRVMALAAAPAPRRRGSLLAPLFTCVAAAALLVVLGLTLVVPGVRREREKKVAENLGAGKAVMDLAAHLPAKEPEKERALLLAQIEALGLRERTAELTAEFEKDPDGKAYLDLCKAMIVLADRGDIVELRDRARQGQVRAALRSLETRRAVAVRAPDAAKVRFGASVPEEFQCAVRGHLNYMNGQYDAALADFDRALDVQSTQLFRANANGATGRMEEALADYSIALNTTTDAWTSAYAASALRGHMNAARHCSLWVGGKSVEHASDTEIAGSLKQGDIMLCYAKDAGDTFIVLAPDTNPRWQTLRKVQRTFPHRGVVKFEGQLNEVVESNPTATAEIQMLKVMVERSTRDR